MTDQKQPWDQRLIGIVAKTFNVAYELSKYGAAVAGIVLLINPAASWAITLAAICGPTILGKQATNMVGDEHLHPALRTGKKGLIPDYTPEVAKKIQESAEE